MQPIDLIVGKRAIGGAVRDCIREALSARRDRDAGVGVEQRDVLHEFRPPLPYELHDSIRRKVLIHDYRYISRPVLNGRFYQVKAVNPNGHKVKLYIDAYSGRIVKIKA